ncbi:MAG: toll/interleukin-1 receptor domain-containing protein [Myxococcota bacterium]
MVDSADNAVVPVAELGFFHRLRARFFGFDVFISYSQSDGLGYAMALESNLKAKDFAVFRDARELTVGNRVGDTIEWALRKSRMLVVVDSPEARRSEWVGLEVESFRKRSDRPITVVKFQQTPPPWRGLSERLFLQEEPEALASSQPSPETVQAIPESLSFGRVNQRARWAVRTVAVLLIALGIGLVQQFFVAQAERRRAEHERDEAEELIDYMVKDLRDSLTVLGRTDVLRGPAQRVLGYFERSSVGITSTERVLLRRNALINLGNVDIEGGDVARAAESFESALAIARQLAEDRAPSNDESQARLADSEVFMGRIRQRQGRLHEADEMFSSAERRMLQLLPDPGADLEWHRILISARTGLAELRLRDGRPEEAREYHHRSLDRLKKLRKTLPSNELLVLDEVVSLSFIAQSYEHHGQPKEAGIWYQRAIDVAGTSTRADVFRRDQDLSALHSGLGRSQAETKEFDGARLAFDEALRLSQVISSHDPSNRRWRGFLATSHDDVGNLSLRMGDTQMAARHYQAAMDIRVALLRLDSNNVEWQSSVATSHNKMASVALQEQQWEAAAEGFRKSNGTLASLPVNADVLQRVAVNHRMIAVSLQQLGRFREAAEACQQSLDAMTALLSQTQDSPLWRVRHEELSALCPALRAAGGR